MIGMDTGLLMGVSHFLHGPGHRVLPIPEISHMLLPLDHLRYYPMLG